MKRQILRASFAVFAALLMTTMLSVDANAETVKLKMASLAPKGSSWANTLEAAGREIKEKTGGEVQFKIYAGGVMGDEGAMVRKMRTGQIAGGALTSVGLGDIEPQLLMLQLPLLFKNEKQLDYVRGKMGPKFKTLMDKKGFKILAWGDVGFNYLFANTPIQTPEDAKKTKMWVWDADPISKEVMKVAGVNATPLGVPDVLPSLSTGVINGFINSPYGAVALQWYTKATYATNFKMAVTIGAIVISNKAWDKIPEKHRAVVAEVAKKHEAKLLKQIRRDNQAAAKTLKKKGIKFVDIAPGSFPKWKKLSDTVRSNLAGKLFDKALLNEMLGHVKNAP